MTSWPDFDDVIDPDTIPVPGSRPRVQHARKENVEPDPVQWDAHPKVYRVDGQDTELFHIGALAAALGRRPSVVKDWERRGWLPRTSLRLSTGVKRSNIRKPGVAGAPVKGRRLYTRAFIEGVISLATETGVDRPGVYVGETDFPARVRDLYFDTMPGAPDED